MASVKVWSILNGSLSHASERSSSTSAKRVLTDSEYLVVTDSLDLHVELFDHFFSFLHNGQVTLVHIIGLEQISRVESLVLEDDKLFILRCGLQLELRDKLLQFYDRVRRLLRFELHG